MVLKFRAWHKEDKEMMDVWSITPDDHISAWTTMEDKGGYVVDYELAKVEVMQSTGLKDKNGKEIFEGDICKVDHQDKRYVPVKVVIEWDAKEAQFSIGCGTHSEVHWSHEVIGNIYSNPELLNPAG